MIRKSYLTVLRNQLRSGHLWWPVRHALKLPAHKLGTKLGRPLAGPIHGVFFTTYACNLRCQFCDLPYRHLEYVKSGREMLSLAEKLAIVDDFAAIGTTAIGFTGGEPMLDADTPALLERAVARGILVHLSTNGHACQTVADTRTLFDLGIHGVSVSLDGACADTHNTIRGSRRSFDAVLTSLRNLLAVRRQHRNQMSITTTTVITRDNQREIPALVELLAELGVDQMGFMPASDIGLDYDVAARSSEFVATDIAELDALVDYLIDYKRRTGRIDNTEQYLRLLRDAFRGRPLPIKCSAGYVTVAVDSWGDIYPCFPWSEMRRVCGNTRQISLAELWRSPQGASMREQASRCRDCYWNAQTELNLMITARRDDVEGYRRASFSRPVPDVVASHLARRNRPPTR